MEYIKANSSTAQSETTIRGDSQLNRIMEKADVTFTCKLCKHISQSLPHFLDHLRSGCEMCKDSNAVPKRKRGRPRLTEEERTYRQTNEYKRKKAEEALNESLEMKRNTRCKTGSIKRKSVADIISEKEGYISSDAESNEEAMANKYIAEATNQERPGLQENIKKKPQPVKSLAQRRKEKNIVKKVVKKCGSFNNMTFPDLNDSVLEAVENIKGDISTIIYNINEILQGVGVIKYVAVEHSKEVLRINDQFLEYVGVDENKLSDSEDEQLSDYYSESDDGDLILLPTAKQEKTTYHTRIADMEPLPLLPFDCRRCKTSAFETMVELEVHLQCHVLNGPDISDFFCPLGCCKKKSYSQLLEHIIIHDEYKRKLEGTRTLNKIYGEFVCHVCGEKFQLKSKFDRHMNRKHCCQKVHCSQCGEDVEIHKFVNHQKTCHEYEFQCKRCKYNSRDKEKIEEHSRVHLGMGFSCGICKKIFANTTLLQAHIKRHQLSTEKRFICTVCITGFGTMDALKKHNRRFHEHVELLECPHCPYKTKMDPDLKKHICTVHTRLYNCTVHGCDFGTNKAEKMEEHTNVYHNPAYIHPCDVDQCYFKAPTIEEYREHMTKAHNLGSKHSCPVCGKYFKKKTHMVRHLVSHTGEKVYKCGECTKSFFTHSTYYRHRNKTGHDSGREGIVSVPQNIVIQYVDTESKELYHEETINPPPKQDLLQPAESQIAHDQDEDVIMWVLENSDLDSLPQSLQLQ